MSGSDASSSVSEDSQPPMDIDYPLNTPTEVPDTDGGLFKTVLVEGTGTKPVKGAKVTVHYVGTLEDGTPFDSSRDRGEFFEFTLGKGQVIKGWDKGVATMRIGEKAILKCSPDYAYGPNGSPPKIPGNATLLFEVELFDWTREVDISKAKDRSLMKSVLVDGVDYENPAFESELLLDLSIFTGAYTPENASAMQPVFSKKEWLIQIGEVALPPMLEKCLESMRNRESAVFRVSHQLVPAEGVPAFSIPAAAARGEDTADITYVVEIHSLRSVKTWDYHGAEKIAEGAKRKDKGNAHFKAGELDLAERFYRRALEFVGEDYGYGEEDKPECHKVRIATLGNLSQVLLMKKQYADVVVNCDKILALDGSNAKALFRLAKAQDGLQEWDTAARTVEKLLTIEPGNTDALALKSSIHAAQKAFDAKQKSVFKKMFA